MDDNEVHRLLLLCDLKRELNNEGYSSLQLTNLDALRNEVQWELDRMRLKESSKGVK